MLITKNNHKIKRRAIRVARLLFTLYPVKNVIQRFRANIED